jgi:hypothetical protein
MKDLHVKMMQDEGAIPITGDQYWFGYFFTILMEMKTVEHQVGFKQIIAIMDVGQTIQAHNISIRSSEKHRVERITPSCMCKYRACSTGLDVKLKHVYDFAKSM